MLPVSYPHLRFDTTLTTPCNRLDEDKNIQARFNLKPLSLKFV